LHWNSFECCWDCPCHGSHFAVDGTPLNAPAISGLTKVDERHAVKGGAKEPASS
jgi:Rieske Fe-S protein